MARSFHSQVIMEIPRVWATTDYPLISALVAKSYGSRDAETVAVTNAHATNEFLEEVVKAGKEFDSSGRVYIANNILAVRAGKDPKIARISTFPETLRVFMDRDRIDGWLYKEYRQGDKVWYLPYLVTGTDYEPPRDQGEAYASVYMAAVAFVQDRSGRGQIPVTGSSVSFTTTDIKGHTMQSVLAQSGWHHETPDLRKQYDDLIATFKDIVQRGFAKQYVVTEVQHYDRRSYTSIVEQNVRVISDTKLERAWDLDALTGSDYNDDTAPMPMNPTVSVFDLKRHEFTSVYSMHMSPYVYRTDLRDKLVLPEGHKDLLDVLTTDLEVFTTDIIEGKSAGNVILAKGVPGVGKTLTAEVYSEIVEHPLYSVHSGELGTNPSSIREALEKIFKRAKRWDAVLLLDEADVFVRERGDSIEHNAIVAEFLRTLEYFDGLLFMTTNRDDTIDEAIISRCAAIITYSIPTSEDAERIWDVLAGTMGINLPTGIAKSLAGHLASASPRDIKMVLRLAARVAAYHSEDLAIKHFRQASMFRGVKWTGSED